MIKKIPIIATITIALMTFFALESFGEQPQYGGILKRINPSGARVIGYYPEMGPQDSTEALPVVECLMEMSERWSRFWLSVWTSIPMPRP